MVVIEVQRGGERLELERGSCVVCTGGEDADTYYDDDCRPGSPACMMMIIRFMESRLLQCVRVCV